MPVWNIADMWPKSMTPKSYRNLAQDAILCKLFMWIPNKKNTIVMTFLKSNYAVSEFLWSILTNLWNFHICGFLLSPQFFKVHLKTNHWIWNLGLGESEDFTSVPHVRVCRSPALSHGSQFLWKHQPKTIQCKWHSGQSCNRMISFLSYTHVYPDFVL